MEIHGFQKMTLLDYPGKVASTVFLAGCNFRCPFCHNARLVTKITLADYVPQDEVIGHLKMRKGLLDGVCITGGEPLISDDVFELMKEIKSLGLLIKLDTNGSFPERLRRAVFGGLCDSVAMDIKNSPEKYGLTAGLEKFDIAPIKESVEFLRSGAVDCEFRTTVMPELHTPEDIEAIGQWIKGADRYYLQAFKDSGELISGGFTTPTPEFMESLQKIAAKYVNKVEVRGF